MSGDNSKKNKITFRRSNIILEKLQESEKFLRSFFKIIDEMIFTGTFDRKIVYANAAVSEKLFFCEAGLKNMYILDVNANEYKKESESANLLNEEKNVSGFYDIVSKIVNELNLTKEIAEELVIDFVEMIPKMLDELENAIHFKDYREITRISHSIKGAASNLRMQELAEICFELEKKSKSQDLELSESNIKDINNIYLRLHMEIEQRELKGK